MHPEFRFRTIQPSEASDATANTVFDIMRVYQLDHQTPADDGFFTLLPTISSLLQDPGSIWLALECQDRFEGFAWIQIDREQRLAKIHRAYVNPSLPGGREAAVEALVANVISELGKESGGTEVIYTTMRPLAYSYDLVRNLGFKILGIFPNGKEIDNSVVNSLAAYYYEGVLTDRRQAQLSLHPFTQPLYEITRQECGLAELPTEEISNQVSELPDAGLPTLEMITAPNFVARRFARLKTRQFLSMQFYPFQEPDTLITDPNQSVEVFIKTFPESGMAAVIGERLDLNVNPVALYQTIANLLKERGIPCVEVINDAGDIHGNDAIIKAGFLPCAYFPGLKRQGQSRRDFVVFARSFENFRYPNLDKIGRVYVEYLKQFSNLEIKAYHGYMAVF